MVPTQNSFNSTITNATTITFDATNTIDINSYSTISIGNDDVDQNINIGTSGKRILAMGSTNGAASLALRYGTGDMTLASATGTVISALDTGEITMPLQPAFLAKRSSTVSSITGNGTIYIAIFDTEIYDQSSDYNNTTAYFTAPVTGRHLFSCNITYGGASSATRQYVELYTSNRLYRRLAGYDNNGIYSLRWLSNHITHLVDMDAGDTACVKIMADGAGSDNAQFLEHSYFSGKLIC